MSRHNKFPLNVLLLSIILLLVSIYVALRIFLPKYQKYILEQPQTKLWVDFPEDQPKILHPYLGFVEQPEADKDINRFGFQGPEPITRKSKDKVIIGITGGSLSLLYYNYEKKSLAEKLKTFPAFKNKKIEVYSLGLSGFKQPQQLMTLNYFLTLGGQFDIVINIDGFNEAALPYAENLPQGVSSFFPRNWALFAGRTLSTADYKLLASIQKHEKRRDATKLFFSNQFFKNHFRLIQSFLDIYELGQIRNLNLKLAESLKQDKNNQATEPEIGSKEEREKNIIDVWKQSSIQMSKLAKGNNILYLHFLQPNQYVPNSKILTKNELECCYSVDQRYKEPIEKLYPKFINEGKSLKDSGVIFSDLTMVFKNINNDVYFDNCCHLNALGYSTLTENIVPKIVQNYN